MSPTFHKCAFPLICISPIPTIVFAPTFDQINAICIGKVLPHGNAVRTKFCLSHQLELNTIHNTLSKAKLSWGVTKLDQRGTAHVVFSEIVGILSQLAGPFPRGGVRTRAAQSVDNNP